MHPIDLTDLTNQLNFMLSLMAERLDRMEGYRGDGLKLVDENNEVIHGFIKR